MSSTTASLPDARPNDASMVSTRAFSCLVAAVVALVALPFEIIAITPEVRLALCDVLGLGAMLAITRVRVDDALLLVAVGLALSLASVAAIAIVGQPGSRAFFSWAYFAKPHLALFVGYALGRDPRFARLFLKWWTLIFTTFCLASWSEIYADQEKIRLGYSLFGNEIFGVYGANAYAVYLAVGAMLLVATLEQSTAPWPLRVVAAVGFVAAVALVFISLSRQSALAMGIFLAIVGLRVVLVHPAQGLVFASMAILSALALIASGVVDPDRWTDRLRWTNEGIETGDLSLLSTGRTEIWSYLAKMIASSPVFGTGFLGWGFQSEELGQPAWIEQGLSPHNQWLGTVWRMGFLPAIPYFLGLALIVGRIFAARAWGGSSWTLKSLVFVVLFVLAMTQDILTYPLTGYLLLLLVGALYADTRRASLQ